MSASAAAGAGVVVNGHVIVPCADCGTLGGRVMAHTKHPARIRSRRWPIGPLCFKCYQKRLMNYRSRVATASNNCPSAYCLCQCHEVKP